MIAGLVRFLNARRRPDSGICGEFSLRCSLAYSRFVVCIVMFVRCICRVISIDILAIHLVLIAIKTTS